MPRPDLVLQDATFVAFDTETTGLYPLASQLVEVGAVRFSGLGEEIAVFEQLIDPGVPIPLEAQQVNRITDRMVWGQPTVEHVIPGFIDFLAGLDNILLAHNAPFDLEFVGVDMIRLGLPLPRHMVFDTCLLAQAMAPRLGSYRLESLGVVLGVASRQDHRALSDASLTKDVFLSLIKRDPRIRTIADLAGVAPPLSFERAGVYRARAPKGFEALGKATDESLPVEIVYEGGSGGEEPSQIKPRALLQYGSHIFLAAYSHPERKEKMYRLDRIKSFRTIYS